jgi:hypothetical protein
VKYEIIITRWDDGLFRRRTRIVADSETQALELVDAELDEMEKKYHKEEVLQTIDDDDIPF